MTYDISYDIDIDIDISLQMSCSADHWSEVCLQRDNEGSTSGNTEDL